MQFDLKKFGGAMIGNATEELVEALNETKKAVKDESQVLVKVGLDILNSSAVSDYGDYDNYDVDIYGSGVDQDYGSGGHAKVDLTSLVDNVLLKVRKRNQHDDLKA